MSTEYIVGNDGSADFGTLGFANLASWSATFTRTSTAITGFADTAVRRRLGVLDVTGSAGGHMYSDLNSPGSTPSGHFIAGTDGTNASNIMDGQNIALYTSDPAGTSANPVAAADGRCGFNITAVISSIAVAVDKNGDSTVTFNWEASGGGTGAIPTIVPVWDET